VQQLKKEGNEQRKRGQIYFRRVTIAWSKSSIGNSKGILAPAPGDRNPRTPPGGIPAFLASRRPSRAARSEASRGTAQPGQAAQAGCLESRRGFFVPGPRDGPLGKARGKPGGAISWFSRGLRSRSQSDSARAGNHPSAGHLGAVSTQRRVPRRIPKRPITPVAPKELLAFSTKLMLQPLTSVSVPSWPAGDWPLEQVAGDSPDEPR
jgi:hypothetical protein